MNVFLFYRDAKMLALTGFHNWFKSSIHKWLQIVHDRSCDRIRKAVETDKVRNGMNNRGNIIDSFSEDKLTYRSTEHAGV